MGALAIETANKLLDFTQKLDIGLLDTVVGTLYAGSGDQQKLAQQILTTLKEHPEAWTKVDAVLEYSKNPQTKYYVLQILEGVIKSRWKVLPRNQCDGIKNFIVGIIIKTSSDAEQSEKEKTYLNKLNMILVQILKHEWPKNWESFIPDIVTSSKTSESLCQNNMKILKLLSEEVFDFSSGQMTQAKAKYMKDTMSSQFSQIFQLCELVLDSSQNPSLVSVTLETLLRFLNWIPLGYIFETKIINTLITKFLNVPMFRNLTLKCLSEIAALKEPKYDELFLQLYTQTMSQLEIMLPVTTNVREAYSNGQDAEQQFIQDLALFFGTYLKEHGILVEKEELKDTLLKALHYLLLISEVDEIEIFKICLEYWNTLACDLYGEFPNTLSGLPSFFTQAAGGPFGGMRDEGMDTPLLGAPKTSRKQFYQPVLTKARYIMISRMAKPEEVLVVENDQGEAVREVMKDTDSMNMYKNMRTTLVYLTHLDYEDTERIMTERMQTQVNGTEWSWKNLNTLCWAVGSISGSMQEATEKTFLVKIIKDLLGLCEQKKKKGDKAIVASNIMYIVGQYPRFLKAHWRFLKTVVNKLFEFMHETHEGVQDMACDTFIKITQKCRKQFVHIQVGEIQCFIDELLANMNSIISDLQPQQVHTFYEAVGYMISASTDPQQQAGWIEKYMQLPNQVWDDVINQASKNVDVLKDQEAVKQLGSILKTNVRAARAIGHPFVSQLGRIYLDMLNVYKVMSENISVAIGVNGEAVTRQPLIKGMRVVKKETLKLISCWVEKSQDENTVLKDFIPPLLDAVLLDYQRCNVPAAREPEVLSTMATIVATLKHSITPEIPKIFDAVFGCTLEMINKDFEEFPEHRTNFYTLLEASNDYCFPAFLTIPQPQFKLILDSIVWAFKHTMRDVAEIGLGVLLQLLKTVSSQLEAAQGFYQTYYTTVLHHLLTVVTDTSHTSGLTMHATILAFMFSLVETKRVTVDLNPDNAGKVSDMSQEAIAARNMIYVQEFIANILKTAFPHLTQNQVKITVQGFFSLDQDVPAFKDHLRDFLVQIKQSLGEDDSDLFLEDKEASLKAAQEAKHKIQSSVPGILNPHEISEEMEEM